MTGVITRPALAFAAAVILVAGAAEAAAAPVGKPVTAKVTGGVPEANAWDCSPYHCYWHPNYYGGWHRHYYGFYRGARQGWW